MSRRERIRRHRVMGPAYRVVVFVIGVTVIGTGLALLVLPGPGWLIIFAGLAILATEFVWAERLLHKSKQKALLARDRALAKARGRAARRAGTRGRSGT